MGVNASFYRQREKTFLIWFGKESPNWLLIRNRSPNWDLGLDFDLVEI